ncbi:hypothetical protein MFFC18_23400 [Mariniblastus fucicola]|uniref:Signal peptide prediction n=2 Tax=Mariniblastus fucicola TaxID=980251 RepID=A0A5B9PBP6_9BACT|nr:hypothetical protein MFFC18_23400 [Mariniblastus fucicola]
MFVKLIQIIWTSPNTLIGLVVGSAGLLTGGKAQIREGCIEFYGGVVEKWLEGLNVFGMTLGHTILGQTKTGLRIVRKHEQVHVRQYERWGPLFLPAYLGWSAWLWMIGKDYYRLNPFEVEAYAIDDPANRNADSDDSDDGIDQSDF